MALREKVEHPKHLRRAEKRVKKLQRELLRKQKGAKNYEKARQKLAKLQAYISNVRNDFLHKLSKAIIDENQVVVVEDINVKGLMQSNLAKSISDSNWSKLLTCLKYKAEWYGRTFIQKAKADISIYGQESNYTIWRLAKMNLARLPHQGPDRPRRHLPQRLLSDLKADFILANFPFNVSDWGGERLCEDKRWKYGVPPVHNAKFPLLQQMIYCLVSTECDRDPMCFRSIKRCYRLAST